MADASVTSLDVQPDGLHIIGANFTQTTTTVYVDDITTAASYVSATELLVSPAPAAGAEIVVEKGGVQTTAVAVPASDNGNAPPALPEPEAPPAGGSAGNTGPVAITAEDLKREQDKGGSDPVGDPVEPGPKVETAQSLGITGPTPYPTGSPAIPPTAGVPMNEAPKASDTTPPPAA